MRIALITIAAVVGYLLMQLAPGDWPAGIGTVEVDFRGVRMVTATVDIGAREEITVEGAVGDASVEVTFPDGIPVDAEVAATIGLVQRGVAIEPMLDEVTLTLELADGRMELVPVILWNASTQQLEALRRPTQQAAVVLGLLGFVVVLWVTEAFPLFVTSLLIPVVLVMSEVAGASAATAPFFNPIIVLFFAGFLMAEAMHRTGLDHYVAVTITAGAGRTATTLFGAMLALTAFLSMWMSNTAATAVLVPIAVAITDPLGEARFQRALVLGIAYAATIGGVGSAIGTPANQLAIEFLGEYGDRTISFVEWFAYGLPMVVLFLPIMGVFLWRRSHMQFDPATFREARRAAEAERHKLGGFDRDQLVVLVVFAAVAAGWVTQTFHGVHPGIVALAGAVALFMLGKLQPDDLSRISWSALLTFGGGLTLGVFLVETGTSDYVATRLTGLANWPPLLATLAVAMVTLLLTTVASNTASAAILIPLAIPLAAVLGVPATALVIVVAIASSIDFALVIGTPPTMIAYSTHLYTAGQIFRKGILLDLAGVVLLVVVVTQIWGLIGIV
ncbi:MAG TPA: DASS family sodium-coupled anion symporter [Acidimicrobiia bacterium]|jgi:sodium-dependent dicarboxylate transporter 2/3/5|nr:DASS family sodium-coupled anion symporter [Acidimicrobiia bacterium]